MKSNYSEFPGDFEVKHDSESEFEFKLKNNNYQFKRNYKIFRGEPKCINNEIEEYDANYQYDYVRFESLNDDLIFISYIFKKLVI
jgi:hypothetical protein